MPLEEPVDPLYFTLARLATRSVVTAVRNKLAPMGSPAVRFAKVRVASGPRLHYAEDGNPDGQPVVFLHGWPDSWFSFSRVLAGMPQDFRALAVD